MRDIEPPRDVSASDRDKMRDNMLGRDVLDGARFPAIDVRARFSGTADGGTVEGDLVVRGRPHPFTMPVRAAKEGDVLVVTGTWEGTLNGLGIKPFKALLGALKLEDWIRLRVEARLRAT